MRIKIISILYLKLTNDIKMLNTVSPNSYGITTKDKDFKNALIQTDYLVLDGVYFALASIILNGKNIQKNQGADVFSHFMERMNKNNGKVFLLGSTTETLIKMKERAKKEYPNVNIQFYSPPFKEVLSDD